MKGLILAFQFLTKIPIRFNVEFNRENVRNMLFFFPFVGFVAGLIPAVCAKYVFSHANNSVAALFTLIIIIFISGLLHIDGYADTVDALMANRDREKSVEILKDSRIGVFACVAIVLAVLARFVTLQQVIENKNFYILFIITVISRTNAMIFITYSNLFISNGLVSFFKESSNKNINTFIATIFFILLMLYNLKSIIFILLSFTVFLITKYTADKKFGGINGDTTGFSIEISELLMLLLSTQVML